CSGRRARSSSARPPRRPRCRRRPSGHWRTATRIGSSSSRRRSRWSPRRCSRCSGLLRLGAVADLISKPVMTGFLFGLGLTIAVGQLPKVLGVDGPGGDFFPRLWGVLGELGDIQPATAAVGGLSIVWLFVLRLLMPAFPGVFVVLVLSIRVSWLFDLKAHGVDVVGTLPS